MGAYISLAGLLIQVLFLGVVLSVVGVYTNRIINNARASRHSLSKQKNTLSHADAARARAHARARRASV